MLDEVVSQLTEGVREKLYEGQLEHCTKLATKVRLCVTVKLYDDDVETNVPLCVQFENTYPEAGLAVTVAVAPFKKEPPPPVVPPAVGLEAVKILW